MQGMTELMKQGPCIVETQKAGLPLGGLGKIQHINDDRPDVAFELVLFPERTHPGAAAF